jgi:hypothetical protein
MGAEARLWRDPEFIAADRIRYGSVDGELLGAAFLEEQAGLQLRHSPLPPAPPGHRAEADPQAGHTRRADG